MRAPQRIFLLGLLATILNFAGSSASAQEQEPLKCYVAIQWDGGPGRPPLCGNEPVNLSFRALHDGPVTRQECTVHAPKFTWSIQSVEKTSSLDNPSWVSAGYTDAVFAPNGEASSSTSLSIKFLGEGFHRVTVKVAVKWEGKKSDPNCTSCPDCQDCDTEATHTTSRGKGVVEVGSSCRIDMLLSGNPKVCTGKMKQFSVNGPCLENLSWSAPGGTPESGTGASFETAWSTPGMKTVTASCGSTSRSATIEVIGADLNESVQLAIQTQPPLFETADNNNPPEPGDGLCTISCQWLCQLTPTSSTAAIYTFHSMSWNISSGTGRNPSFTNSGAEQYYFDGVVTGASLNFNPDSLFNEPTLKPSWIMQRHNLSTSAFNSLRNSDFARYSSISDEYAFWFNSHFSGPVEGTYSFSATYKAFSCPADEAMAPSLSDPVWETRSRDDLAAGYPYPRIPNSVRPPRHRESNRHSATAPQRWSDAALAEGSVSVSGELTLDAQGQTVHTATVTPAPNP